MPGFAFGYAVAGFVPNQGLRTKPGGADRDRSRRRDRLWRKPKGVEEGGWLAWGHPIISAGGRALCARATEGEIPSFGTKDEKSRPTGGALKVFGGADRDRTDDLLNAIQALSQLSYGPTGRAVVAKGGGVCQSSLLLNRVISDQSSVIRPLHKCNVRTNRRPLLTTDY